MQEKLNKGIWFGMLGNVAFVVFGLVCLVFYYTYDGGIVSRILEAVAYGVEIIGFGLLIYSDYENKLYCLYYPRSADDDHGTEFRKSGVL